MVVFVVLLMAYTGKQTQSLNISETSSFTDCIFVGLTTSENGGAIYASNSGLGLTVERCYFDRCSAAISGGALYIDANSISLASSTFAYCNATSRAAFTVYALSDGPLLSNCISVFQCASSSYSFMMVGDATTAHHTNSSHNTMDIGAGMNTNHIKSTSGLAYWTLTSNVCTNGELLGFYNQRSLFYSRIISIGNQCLGNGSYFFAGSSYVTITYSYFEILEQKSAVYSPYASLTFTNCYFSISSSYINPATKNNCQYNVANNPYATGDSCVLPAIRTEHFTMKPSPQAFRIANFGLLLVIS